MTSSRDLCLNDLIEAISSAGVRYREHASRDASWVQTWTGEADPELLEIEALIEALVTHEERDARLEDLLSSLLALSDEPILAQALTEALLATDHALMRPLLVERAVELVQEVSEPLSLAAPWLAQALFWSAASFEDIELCAALMGDAGSVCRALPLWLATPRVTPSEHLFARAPGETVSWVEGVHVPDEAREKDVLQGVALALGMTRSAVALDAVANVLRRRLKSLGAPAGIVEPDVAIAAVLEALTVIPGDFTHHMLLRDVLTTPAQGDACAEVIAQRGASHIPMLVALLDETARDADQFALRLRATRALRHMPRSETSANEALWRLTRDAMTPIRHTALYALVERGHEGILERLDAMIREESDALEAEEILFIISSHASKKAEDFLAALLTCELPSGLDPHLIEEALEAGQTGES